MSEINFNYILRPKSAVYNVEKNTKGRVGVWEQGGPMGFFLK
jgi:hypothetical protein